MKRFSKVLAFVLAFAMVFSLNFIPASAAPATSITMRINGYTTGITVAKGDKLAIFKLAKPLGSSTGGTICTSDNENIVKIVKSTVSDAQYIKAVGKGTTIVRVAAKNGSGATGQIKVTVADPAQQAQAINVISLNAQTHKGDTIIKRGQQLLLRTETTPRQASKMMTYESSNEKVAKVSETGRVTGYNGGIAYITVRTKDGSNLSQTVKVTVVSFERIMDDAMTVGDELTVGECFKVRPAGKAKLVSYTSSNPEVLDVQDGKLVAKSAGTAQITLKYNAAELEKTYTFTVNPAPVVLPTEIQAEDIVDLHGGRYGDTQTAQINAKVLPEEADQAVTYTVADPSIVSVDENGVVTGLKRGATTVTITSVADPNVTKTINVNVKEYLTRVTEWVPRTEDMVLMFGGFHWTQNGAAQFAADLQDFLSSIRGNLGFSPVYKMVVNEVEYTITLADEGLVITDPNDQTIDIASFLEGGQSPYVDVKVILPESYVETLLRVLDEENITEEGLQYKGNVMSAMNFMGYNFEFGALNKATIIYVGNEDGSTEVHDYEYFVSKGVLYFGGDVTDTPIIRERFANPNDPGNRYIFKVLDVDWY